VSVRRALVPLVLITALGIAGVLAGCEAEPKWDILPDGSCDPAQLLSKVVPRVDDDPELVAVDILLKNVSHTACALTGVPTVTITDAYQTRPIGGPAVATGDAPETVTLEPQTYVFIYLQTLKSLVDTSSCQGVLTNGIHLLLPGRTDAQAIVISAPVAKYCDEPARGTFLVSAITAEALVVPGIGDFAPKTGY
jgi:hypothetical protein